MENQNNQGIKVLVVILSLLVVGLGGFIFYDKVLSDNDIVNNITTTTTTTPVNSINQNEDIYEKLLKGDYSGVAGEYINSKGEVKILLPNGSLKDEKNTIGTSVQQQSDGSYYWDVDEVDGGSYARVIIPIGIPVNYTDDVINGKDDTSKLRLYEGHALPSSEEDIYFKN